MAKKKPVSNKRKASRGPAKPRKRATPLEEKAAPMDAGQGAGTTRSEQLNSEDNRDLIRRTLDKTVIAIPLLEKLDEETASRKANPSLKPEPFDVIIDLNLEYPKGRDGARKWVRDNIKEIIDQIGFNKDLAHEDIGETNGNFNPQYMFATLEGDVIRELVKRDNLPKGELKDPTNRESVGPRAIYHIWPDFEVFALINKSISTVKADAAQTSFAALGDGIVWAVLDSGIQADHPHFVMHKNLKLEAPLDHADFSILDSDPAKPPAPGNPLKDDYGHGTHVAGIIAGALKAPESEGIRAFTRQRDAEAEQDEEGNISYQPLTNITSISGMAPKCKLLSLKVLNEKGKGKAKSVLKAIAMIQQINGYGRHLLIHGVNLSVGYDFKPEWFACGQSPLCVEVDRLVRSGVVVVAAAGNTGYGASGGISAGVDLTINDPGNAELAITVGSTHRDMPHVYGVSYFSSKGPTGDGRAKPDLVAPGEKIISCAAGEMRMKTEKKVRSNCNYLEWSGTSMAAPHVSGVIAAFLSIRREFIGRPEKVKEIFLSTATDLKRERYFQGHGLVDLMRAIQSI